MHQRPEVGASIAGSLVVLDQLLGGHGLACPPVDPVEEYEGMLKRLKDYTKTPRTGKQISDQIDKIRGGASTTKARNRFSQAYVIYERQNPWTGAKYIGSTTVAGYRARARRHSNKFKGKQDEAGVPEEERKDYKFTIKEAGYARNPKYRFKAECYWIRMKGGPYRYGGKTENKRYERPDLKSIRGKQMPTNNKGIRDDQVEVPPYKGSWLYPKPAPASPLAECWSEIQLSVTSSAET